MATLALALFGATSARAAEESLTIYQWTDSDGVYRYTPLLDRIPDHARHTVVTLESGEDPPQNTPIYFDPDPRAAVVAIPDQPPEAADSGGAAAAPAQGNDGSGEYDERIRVLEARIAEYEEALKEMISAPGADADIEVPPELREIAARLPQLQAELAALERGRATAVGP
jgi:hypothetical protein